MRKPNFNNDNNIYGKFGEDFFESYAAGKRLRFVNVTEYPEFQEKDIDFVVLRNTDKTVESLLFENAFLKKRDSRVQEWYTIEVKTDTRTHGTRNVVYEILSHDNPGCLARSAADYVLYVATDDKATKVLEAWSIKLHEWRTWIREHSSEITGKNDKSAAIRLHNYNTWGDACLNFLCNIDTLVAEGIAKKII